MRSKANADALVDLVSALSDEQRQRIASRCLRATRRSEFKLVVASNATTSGFAFDALAAVDSDLALTHARGDGLQRLVRHLDFLSYDTPALEGVLVDHLREGHLTAAQVCWQTSGSEARMGAPLWSALLDAMPASDPSDFLQRFAAAPSLELLDLLADRRESAFERKVGDVALRRSKRRRTRDMDHNLEAAEAVLLRIGGRGFTALTLQRLNGSHDIEEYKGFDHSLIHETPAIVRAMEKIVTDAVETPSDGRIPMRPFQHLALIAPRRAAALSKRLAALNTKYGLWTAGEIATQVGGKALSRIVLAGLQGRRSVRNNWLELRLLNVAGDDARARRVAERCLAAGDDWGRSLAAWTGHRLKDDKLLRKVLSVLLAKQPTLLGRRDINTLADLVEHPTIGPELTKRIDALPSAARRRLLADADLCPSSQGSDSSAAWRKFSGAGQETQQKPGLAFDMPAHLPERKFGADAQDDMTQRLQ